MYSKIIPLIIINFMLISCLKSNIDPNSETEENYPFRILYYSSNNKEIHYLEMANDSNYLVESFTSDISLYRSQSGRFGIAVERDENKVHFIDGGIYSEDHGTHLHPYWHPLTMLNYTLTEPKPTHVSSEQKAIAVFHDGSGRIQIIKESELSKTTPASISIQTEKPHHGTMVLLENEQYITTHPGDTSSVLPNGVHVRNGQGTITYTVSDICPGLHGNAGNNYMASFGCTDGVLVVSTNGKVSHQHITNPSDMPEGARIGTLIGHENLNHFYGKASKFNPQSKQFEYAGIWKISPIDSSITPMLSFQGKSDVSWSMNTDGTTLGILWKNGSISLYDTKMQKVTVEKNNLIQPLVDLGSHGSKAPNITLAFDYVFIADPNEQKIKVLNQSDLSLKKEFIVPGMPTKLTILGDYEHHTP